jgi:protein-L-isoaspartate(D-aspartate) O-methyltransferase
MGLFLVLTLGTLFTVAAESPTSTSSSDPDGWHRARGAMVEQQLRRRGVHTERVLEAMAQVPRHRFVPERLRWESYADNPLPIGSGQTISQPYIVALMTELLEPTGKEKVLEIGTGSGYHAAVLSRVVREVYTIEIVAELAQQARTLLAHLGYDNIHVRTGDGYDGWPEEAPFDAIVLTAAPKRIPEPLLAQLRTGGKMVLPLGEELQDLLVVTRTTEGFERRIVTPVRFVPMTGKIEDER